MPSRRSQDYSRRRQDAVANPLVLPECRRIRFERNDPAVVFDMLRSRFLSIESRERAARIIRRASYYFILTALVLLALQALSIHDEWVASHLKATSTTSIESVIGFTGFLLERLLIEDWVYILVLVNAVVLRRFESRAAAAIFIIFGLYGMGLSLFVLWAIGWNALPVSGFLTLFFASYVWVAARAFAAAKKLHGEFKNDPASPVSTAGGRS
jgi:hypothetical protein